MPKFQKFIQVNASEEKTWEVVGDLAVMGEFVGAADVNVEGMTRVCTFPNGVVQHEEISNYSKEQRSYDYAIEGSPLPVRNNRGRFAVSPAGLNSTITWDAEFEPLDPSQERSVAEMWEGVMIQYLPLSNIGLREDGDVTLTRESRPRKRYPRPLVPYLHSLSHPFSIVWKAYETMDADNLFNSMRAPLTNE